MSEADLPSDDERRGSGRALWQSLVLDRFLDAVFRAEGDGVTMQVPVTVLVGGTLIAGDAISFPHYLQLLGEAMQATGVTMVDGDGRRERVAGEHFARPYHNARAGMLREDAGPPDPGMLFLKDARVLMNAGPQPPSGFLIAVEVGQVQGWALGALAAG